MSEDPELLAGGMLRRSAGYSVAVLALLLMLFCPPPEGLDLSGWKVACVALLMAGLWITEAMPMAATALLPLALLPLAGVAPVDQVAPPYASPVIYLFLGGFMISLAMERWGLHRRIALAVLARVGSRPDAIIGGFMLASALLSMWISNAATTLMMLPIAMSVTQLLSASDREAAMRFAPPLMLGLAYASSIGGLGTPIGTPPNAFLVGHMQKEHGLELSFMQFMAMGFPIMLVSLPVVFWVLTRLCFRVPRGELPGAGERLAAERAALGPMTRGELLTSVVFCSAALLWITRPLLAKQIPVFNDLGDAGVAVAAGISLFLLPVDFRKGVFVMDWKTASRVPWDVLILFGGGLTLASQIESSGLADWLGAKGGGLAGLPVWVAVLVLCLIITFLTELTSNTAPPPPWCRLLPRCRLAWGTAR
jgi:sodium-dependent dicarboxylate transporter 2/3/5